MTIPALEMGSSDQGKAGTLRSPNAKCSLTGRSWRLHSFLISRIREQQGARKETPSGSIIIK